MVFSVWNEGKLKLSPTEIPGNKLTVIASDSYTNFGVLSSRLHTTWGERKGSTHGVANDLSYTPFTTFETFPFPRPTPEQRAAIEKAAKYLETIRDHLKAQRDSKRAANTANSHDPEAKTLTLTGMYNLLTEYRETGTELVTRIKGRTRH